MLKSLLPYIAKDVSTSEVQNEEQAIFRAQELDLIYAQYGLLYEIIPNALHSSFDPKVKLGPHANGIVGCASAKPADSVAKQVSQLPINQSASGQAMASSQPTQTTSVLSVCNHWTRRVTNSPDKRKRRVRIIVRVGIGMRMLIIMTKMPVVLGGTSKLNVRLNSLASCVRTITSLTYALVLMKPQDSWHRAQLC